MSPDAALTPEAFAEQLDVSRETLSRLSAYLELLSQWQQRINLVGAATLADPWRRHILDAAQLVRFVRSGARSLTDVGSGAGIPGLIIACITELSVNLIESDTRKCAFLQIDVGNLGIGDRVHIHNTRVERARLEPPDMITARAFAPLARILELTNAMWAAETQGLFLKGKSVDAELTEAKRNWTMRSVCEPSLSSSDGCILRVWEPQRVRS